MIQKFKMVNQEFQIKIARGNDVQINIELPNRALSASIQQIDEHTVSIIKDNKSYTVHFVLDEGNTTVAFYGEQLLVEKIEEQLEKKRTHEDDSRVEDGKIGAPMPGKILKMLIGEGDKIKRNQPLFIIEAMKMENEVKSPLDGQVKKIYFKEQELVSVGEPIVEVDK
jgi:biotin carboxyl carrier protein